MILSQYIGGAGGAAGDVIFIGTPTQFVYSGSNTNSNSFSHDRLGGSKTALIILVMTKFPPNSVTYNGFNLQLIRSDGFDEASTSVWMGNDFDMAIGINTVEINHSVSQSGCIMWCDNLDNVDQSNMSDVDDGESGGSLPDSSLSLMIDDGDLMLSCISKRGTTPSLNGDADQQSLMTVQGSSTIDGIASFSEKIPQTAGLRELAYDWGSTSNTSHTAIKVKNG